MVVVVVVLDVVVTVVVATVVVVIVVLMVVVVVVVVAVVVEVSLLSCPQAQQLDAGSLCNKATILRDTTNGTPVIAAAVVIH